MIARMYQAKRPSHSEFVTVRHTPLHVRHWGQPQAGQPTLWLLHGWMDVGASFQFMVDHLSQTHHLIAPDLRGFGLSQAQGVDHFVFPDYMADLDALLRHYQPEGQIDLLGHSMGGNVVMMFAGARPERVHRLINLEGFGMPRTTPSMAPGRYRQWLNELQAMDAGDMNFKTYPSLDAVAQRLQKTNPRLRLDHAQFLASHWAQPTADGQWALLGHPAHKVVNPSLYQVDEMISLYKAITAPTLCVLAQDNEMASWWKGRYDLAEFRERIGHVPQLQLMELPECGHMMHHDQPQALAEAISHFLYAAS
ncbi:MAG: hypothetical protein RL111_956 [Pseudomonadota bacterium]